MARGGRRDPFEGRSKGNWLTGRAGRAPRGRDGGGSPPKGWGGSKSGGRAGRGPTRTPGGILGRHRDKPWGTWPF